MGHSRLVIHGGYHHVHGLEFVQRLAAAHGKVPRFVQRRGHNHMSILAPFDAGEEPLEREILDFRQGL